MRKKHDVRMSEITKAALDVAMQRGWNRITTREVAANVGLVPGTVAHYYDVQSLKDAVMEQAVEEGAYKIVAEGLLAGHPAATGASAEVKAAAARVIAGE